VQLLVGIETVGKMTTINERAVELSVERSYTKNSAGNCWEGGNKMTVGTCFVVIMFPRPIILGGFPPLGGKF
jgi:hypothetical protein